MNKKMPRLFDYLPLMFLAFAMSMPLYGQPRGDRPRRGPQARPPATQSETPPIITNGSTEREPRRRRGRRNRILRQLTNYLSDAELRTISAEGNNVSSPEWGTADGTFLRIAPATYADSISEPTDTVDASAREISNVVMSDPGLEGNSADATDFVWQWGQFLDHDITLTPEADPKEDFVISIPTGDIYFDPTSSGTQTMSFHRSFGTLEDGIRQQVNQITAYIDGSVVYGSDTERALALRALDGTGMLKVSDGDLLPFNEDGIPNAPTASDPSFFLAGDFRANEQVGLTAMHTLFVREHNYWARRIARMDDSLSEGAIYQTARSIVAAEIQAITYNEFLPVLLGGDAIPDYTGYDAGVNAGISNEFATAGYRFGHTMLSPVLLRVDAQGSEITEGNLSLAEAFFTPQHIIDTGIEPVLRGLAAQEAQEVDPFVIDEVRNFLFGPPGAGGFDLAALNIQRGRDHGLPSYNELRQQLGLSARTSFAEVTSDVELQQKLTTAYGSVDTLELWVGCLAEDHLPDAMVGESLAALLKEQFVRLRDGDRFWYENGYPSSFVRFINTQTLSKIIKRNTGIGRELSRNVFLSSDSQRGGRGGRRGGRNNRRPGRR